MVGLIFSMVSIKGKVVDQVAVTMVIDKDLV